jgi:hypothetical protein
MVMLSNNQLNGQGKFSFELLSGGAITLPSTLTIDPMIFNCAIRPDYSLRVAPQQSPLPLIPLKQK